MNKVAFMFPGQGAQAVGMGQELYENYKSAREVFDMANDVLKKDVKKLCFEGPDEALKQTTNTQSCLLTVSLASYYAFMEMTEGRIKPDFALGHSLGEYSAMHIAGVLDLENTFKAIQKRSDLMQEACEKSSGGAMAAILGSNEETIRECLKMASDKGVASVANYNEPNQIVITGEAVAVQFASELIKEKGAKRVVPLAVSGGFHSKLMQSATDGFKEFVTTLNVNDAKFPVVTNVDANYTTLAKDFIEKMPEQISNSVYWTQSIQKLLKEGVTTFVEMGSGKVLSGLNRKMCPADVKTYNVGDKTSLEATIQAFELLTI